MTIHHASPPASGATSSVPAREEIAEQYKWKLDDIYPDWEAWEADLEAIRERMDALVAMRGTLGEDPQTVARAYRLSDEIGMMAYKLYRYPQLSYDVDQRNNKVQARLQQVQAVFAEFGTKTAWMSPEILTIPHDTMLSWIDENEALQQYRFPITEVYREQEHVLDEAGERLLSLASRFNSSPSEAYRALSTADVEFNEITLESGETMRVTYATYQKILHTSRSQPERRRAFEAMYRVFEAKRNTFASIYNATCQRDWAQAQARHFESTAEAALDGNNVPVAVLETLIDVAREGTAPLRRYHGLRRRVLDLDDGYHLYDGSVPLVEQDTQYPYDDVRELIVDSVAPLGEDYQAKLREALSGGWVDVYESEGKRSGAYSAGVYGVHPYMLLNYNDTLDNVFTLAHELGHTLHTVLSDATQPFATASYTIFVAEVASTLNEALLLDHMLERAEDPKERVVLLQKAIDGICGTFYSQALFADFELQAHRLAEQGQPITAERLSELYFGLLTQYYDGAIDLDPLYEMTWARIPHFYNSPFYVYQYATCYASSAQIVRRVLADDEATRQEAVEDYLTLLRSGGDDHPMAQLQKAGVDLTQETTVAAVVEQLDGLVGMLEQELDALE